jgi:hypothetical protein
MATTVGLLHLEFHIPAAVSLKDKRRAVKSFKDRVRNSHNVSVAEVASLDDRRRAVLAVAMVGNDARYLGGALQRIVRVAENQREMILAERELEWV